MPTKQDLGTCLFYSPPRNKSFGSKQSWAQLFKGWINCFPPDSDSYCGKSYPPFEQHGPAVKLCEFSVTNLLFLCSYRQRRSFLQRSFCNNKKHLEITEIFLEISFQLALEMYMQTEVIHCNYFQLSVQSYPGCQRVFFFMELLFC